MSAAIVSILGGFVVLGIVQGIGWALIAPGSAVKVFANGSYVALPTSSYHSFVGLAIFVLTGAVIGLVTAVAIWRIRAIRGSIIMLTIAIGSTLGALTGYLTGLLMASGTDPAQLGATGTDSIVVAAPQLATVLVIIAQPLVAVMTYTLLAAWDGRPDLGRRRAFDAKQEKNHVTKT